MDRINKHIDLIEFTFENNEVYRISMILSLLIIMALITLLIKNKKDK